jgi:hypothetical protein
MICVRPPARPRHLSAAQSPRSCAGSTSEVVRPCITLRGRCCQPFDEPYPPDRPACKRGLSAIVAPQLGCSVASAVHPRGRSGQGPWTRSWCCRIRHGTVSAARIAAARAWRSPGLRSNGQSWHWKAESALSGRQASRGGPAAAPDLRDASRHGEQRGPGRTGNPDRPGVDQVASGAADQNPDHHIDRHGGQPDRPQHFERGRQIGDDTRLGGYRLRRRGGGVASRFAIEPASGRSACSAARSP